MDSSIFKIFKYKPSLITVLLFCLLLVGACDFKEHSKLSQILEAGNKAFAAKQFDEAIRQYDRGLAIRPTEAVFLMNKSSALLQRGIDRYNKSIQSTDPPQVKAAEKEGAGKDFHDAQVYATAALEQFDSPDFWMIISNPNLERDKLSVYGSKAESLRLIASVIDKNRAIEARVAIHEYVKREKDKDKKTKAQLGCGKMLLETSNGNHAIAEYRSVLNDNPDNIEGVLGVGLSLSQSGDKKQFKEAVIYLERFVKEALDQHPLKASVKESLDYLKQESTAQ